MIKNIFYFIILFTFFCSLKSNAQSDTVKNKPFTFFKIGIDLAKLGASFLQPNYRVAEFQFEANGKKNNKLFN